MPTRLASGTVVLDTNVVLDLLLFADPSVHELGLALAAQQILWVSTVAMREEFVRVLAYPQIDRQIATRGRSPAALVQEFDRFSHLTAAAPTAPVRCSDSDDQMFVDLAVAHQACLLSKDDAVLRLRKRLLPWGVTVRTAWPGAW